jgi:hypothetical protein
MAHEPVLTATAAPAGAPEQPAAPRLDTRVPLPEHTEAPATPHYWDVTGACWHDCPAR